ncbi:MAG: DUF393 domain-containing protein [Chlorobi bacterium]|nr:DUF393 domain-containing protein [Chlorobiota bacterium]
MGKQRHSRDHSPDSILVFVDAYCPLCHWLAKWLRKRDKHNKFQFHPLASQTAKNLLPDDLYANTDTVVVYHNDKIYTKGRAVAHLLQHLPRWKIVGHILKLVPDGILNLGYTIVAKMRYKIFGKYDSCWLDKDSNFN